jgi:N-acetylneuraminic acid mutarotase
MKNCFRLHGLLISLLLFASTASAQELPPLPVEVASFGAAVSGDALYVYGGHVGKTHQHSVDNLSHRFFRLSLSDPGAGWVDLGEVKGLQGLPLVAWGDRVCRVGGLDAKNAQDAEEEDLVSTDAVACFDPESTSWQSLPPLPAPRSSHDAVVAGNHLYVVGGWQLRGEGQEPRWH